MKSLHRTAGIALLLASSGVLHAQTTGTARSSIALDEVVVLGTRIEESLPEDLQRFGSRLDVITAQQIEAGGFNDVAQALQNLVPGLSVLPKNGPFDYVDVSLAGSRNADIVFLIDGVRISNRLYAGTTPLDTIPAHMVERIEVLREGQGLFYGTQAVAGVVNIVTRAHTDALDVGAGIALDSNDGRHANASVSQGWGATHVALFGSYDQADGFQPFRDQDYQRSATDRERGYDVKSAGLKLAQGIGDRITISTLYQYTDAELDFAGARRTRSNINDRQEQLASLKLDFEASDRVGLYLKTYYHDWTTHYTTINNVVSGGQITGQTVVYDNAFWGYTDKGLNLMTRLRLHPGLEYLLGADVQKYSGADEVLTIARDAETTRAGFVQVRTTPDWLPDTSLAAGLRYNRTSQDEGGTIWNISGKQQLGNGYYLRGTLGTSFRLPDAYQLFGAQINDGDTRGNPKLRPEKSRNLDLGIGGALGGSLQFKWELTAFRRTVTDLIGSVDDGFTDVDADGTDDYDSVAMNTAAEVRMRGGELTVSLQADSGWNVLVDHTHSNARESGSTVQIQRIPLSYTKLSLGYAPARGRFTGDVSLLSMGDVFQVVNGTRYNYGDYATVATSLGWFLDGAHKHRFGLNVRNLFDKEYATRLTSVTPDAGGAAYAAWNVGEPRTFQLRYSYSLGGR